MALSLFASDPPHTDGEDYCASCHLVHHALGAPLFNTPGGNANLCQSCHVPGGSASAKALVNSDQAVPARGLPAGTTPSGTSHRWDSGPAGRVLYVGGATNASTGTVQSGGAFGGVYAKTYTVTIATPGPAGVAQFNWIATAPGGGNGNGLTTGTNVLLDEGITVTFGGDTNAWFQAGDQWQVFVRPDLRQPTNAILLAHLTGGQMSCSSCHQPHSQAAAPFDPSAPAYAGAGTGAGRHYQAIDNNTDQMCLDCHAPRHVTNSIAGSHPVDVLVPTNSSYRVPSALPLDQAGQRVFCSTCHEPHFAASTDGSLLRLTNRLALCTDCHALADTAAPAAHFDTAGGVLWPGGQYGTTFPALSDPALRGTCENCHQPHGWPVTGNTATHYPKLLVDLEENVCFTCHDANGPAAKNVKDDFAKLRHHPVNDSQQAAGRSVECSSCHNPHTARSGAHPYTATATATRNLASNPLKGADGVAVTFTNLSNFQAVPTNRYTLIAKTTGVTYEYQVCLKCHSGYSWTTPPKGQSPNGSAATPVETDLAQEFSPMNKSGHPIITGLDNYPNSIPTNTPARRGLQPAQMKAPWNVNVGQQTMMCSDCHNTDVASPAAQGPHGSAAQFMLRGPNAANWPNVTLANYATSWCANCHNSVNNVHSNSHHTSRPCYVCHIVVPHGGKLSRLIADNDTMPARYGYNNTLNTSYLQGFTKRGTNTYSASNCKAGCTDDHSGRTPAENW